MSENGIQEFLSAESAEQDLGTKLQQIAADAIPNLVSGAMRTEMLRLQAMEEHYTKLREEYKKLDGSYHALKELYDEQTAKFQDLNSREHIIQQNEQALGLKELEYTIKNASLELREDHALVRVSDHKEMFHGLVRNTTFRNKVLGMDSHTVNTFEDGYTDSQGTYHAPRNNSQTHTDNKDTDETRTEE